MKLSDIAHCRTGDKGDYSLISVIAYNEEAYNTIYEKLTEDVVHQQFEEIVEGHITRYALPNIGSFIFEMENALGGGVTRTLAMDVHGESLCYAMLDIELD